MALIRTRVRHGVSPMNILIRFRDVEKPNISLDARTNWSILLESQHSKIHHRASETVSRIAGTIH